MKCERGRRGVVLRRRPRVTFDASSAGVCFERKHSLQRHSNLAAVFTRALSFLLCRQVCLSSGKNPHRKYTGLSHPYRPALRQLNVTSRTGKRLGALRSTGRVTLFASAVLLFTVCLLPVYVRDSILFALVLRTSLLFFFSFFLHFSFVPRKTRSVVSAPK